MKTSVLDFIGSKTLRKQLEGQKLSPAIECIIIAQCKEKALADKVEALEERYNAYSSEDFKKGVFNSFTADFKAALYDYIKYKHRLLNIIESNDSETVFRISSEEFAIDGTICKSYEQAVNIVRQKLEDECCTITKHFILGPDKERISVDLNQQQDIMDVYSSVYDDIEYNVQNAYAQIPHKFKKGDIVRFGDRYAVLADVTIHETKPAYMVHSDYTDMCLYCMSYYEDIMHSCGGSFGHQHFPILQTEICSEDELPESYIPLITLSKAVKGELRFVDLLEAYSERRISEY